MCSPPTRKLSLPTSLSRQTQNVKPFYKKTKFTNISLKTNLQLSTKNPLKLCKTTSIKISSEREYTILRPHGSNSPQAGYYGLSKIHKNLLMHPIVSACGPATYNTAKVIIKIFQNYCDRTSSFVNDSTEFIQKVKHLSIPVRRSLSLI